MSVRQFKCACALSKLKPWWLSLKEFHNVNLMGEANLAGVVIKLEQNSNSDTTVYSESFEMP